jgi:hypothetical protein
MKNDPRLKKKLNLLGAMKSRGRHVIDISRNRAPTMKKTPNA